MHHLRVLPKGFALGMAYKRQLGHLLEIKIRLQPRCVSGTDVANSGDRSCSVHRRCRSRCWYWRLRGWGRSVNHFGGCRCLHARVGRREHVRCRIKNLRAASAAYPAAGYPELVRDDLEDGFAGGATGGEAHDRVIVERPSRQLLQRSGHQDPAVFAVRHRQLAVGRVGGLQLIGLTFQNAGQHQGAASSHAGAQQRGQHLEWCRQNIG